MRNLTLLRSTVAATFLAFALTACGSTGTYDDSEYDGSTYEVEDCDAEDRAEGDSDCAGVGGHKTKTPKSGKGTPVTKPKTTKPKTTKPKTSTKSGFGSTSKGTGRR